MWEDYGTKSEQIEALCSKFFLFRIMACYSPVIYVAFVKVQTTQAYLGTCYEGNCLLELNWLLLSLFALQFSFKLVEFLYLFLIHSLQQREKLLQVGSNAPSHEQEKYLSPQVLSYSIYCDLIMNYGYVALFASGCPILVLLVLFLTAIQAKLDAWRLAVLTRRPAPMAYYSWAGGNHFINLLAVLGIMTNPGIVMFSSPYFHGSSEAKLFIFAAIEHCHFLLKMLLDSVISDEAESNAYSVVRQGKQWCDLKEKELCAQLSQQGNSTSPCESCVLPSLVLSDDSHF